MFGWTGLPLKTLKVKLSQLGCSKTPQTREVALPWTQIKGANITINILNFSLRFLCSLTYSEENHHAEHGQQGGDNHAEERRQLLGLPLLAGAFPDVPRLLLRAMAAAGGEAVVEERSLLRHGESCPFTRNTTSWSAFRQHLCQCYNSSLRSRRSDRQTSGHVISKMSIKASNVFPRNERRAGWASRVQIQCSCLLNHSEKARWQTFSLHRLGEQPESCNSSRAACLWQPFRSISS